MSVVVLAYRCRPSVVAAVRSLLEQDVPPEVVVVHSGGGRAPELIAAAGLIVRVVDVRERLRPGGARNVGLAATRGRYVAFLADDCVAAPGWVRERLAAHHSGAAAVASALLCHRPECPVALAAHLALFIRRMPAIEPALALTYGASYDRRLFARYGEFRDDLEAGEDTEFHQRLAAEDKPVWSPRVQTVHAGPETLRDFLAAQFWRGRRMTGAWSAIDAIGRGAVALDAIRRTWFVVRRARSVVAPRARRAALMAIPLIAVGNLVYAAGAWSSPPGNSRR